MLRLHRLSRSYSLPITMQRVICLVGEHEGVVCSTRFFRQLVKEAGHLAGWQGKLCF